MHLLTVNPTYSNLESSEKLAARLGWRAAPLVLRWAERAVRNPSRNLYLPTFCSRLAEANSRTRTLAPDRRRGILALDSRSRTCSPHSARDGPPRQGVPWPSPSARSAAIRAARATRGWRLPSHARCHQGKPGSTWRESREPTKLTRPRNTTSIYLFFFSFIYLFFLIISIRSTVLKLYILTIILVYKTTR